MEELKSAVPDSLKRLVAAATVDDLRSVSSSLLDFFQNLAQFHQMVRDLADPNTALCGKNKEAALKLKQDGNRNYAVGDHAQALTCYSQALRQAPLDADDAGKNLIATLFVNRASLFHKMGLLSESLRDCSRALQISSTYSKAWYRRGKVNASLGNYEDAIRDLTAANNFESSVSGKRQIETELNKISTQSHDKSDSNVLQHQEDGIRISDVTDQINLRCVITPDKGRGLTSEVDIPQASLVHSEEPYAAIILKNCRESHCHYCLNELPADVIYCVSCSIPFYCSKKCQLLAGGQTYGKYPSNDLINGNHSNYFEKFAVDVSADDVADQEVESLPEHKHECHGVNWPAILPSEIVLAGRVVVKSMTQKGHFKEVPDLVETLGFFHCYSKLPPESKLELHVYSIVLLFCLKVSYCSELLINGFSISQITILLSQIRVNSMRIVHLNSSDGCGLRDQFGKFLPSEPAFNCSTEQVRVGQAIYKTGSLFNHSCLPNIHAYFFSRTLLIRATEFVPAGCPLELSYGPQVLKRCHYLLPPDFTSDWLIESAIHFSGNFRGAEVDRLKFLQDEFFFRCWCPGCSEVNASDLVLNGYCCIRSDCPGVVLNSCGVNCENDKLKISETSCLEPLLQTGKLNHMNVKKVAHLSLDKQSTLVQIKSGCCLKCGSYRDLKSSIEADSEAWIHIRRLHASIASEKIEPSTISDALRSLGLLRSIHHAYNKCIAEIEDTLAQAFCVVGDLKAAKDHCKASIEILENLYGASHIVIGHELVKLSSIKLSLDDCSAVDSINQLGGIFFRYYGSHADIIFPYLQFLKKETAGPKIRTSFS